MAIDLGTKALFGFGADPIVIRRYTDGIKGGKVLDTTDYTESYILAGHVIIKNTTTEVYAPMPVSNGAYAALPDGYEYVGVNVASVPVDEPFVGIMTDGEVNDTASPYPLDTIMSAFKTAVPTIRFDHD